ncbi:hypothetical protein [Agrococcus versicolor]|uniref:hypothetical protein n=1 Tax=Agrococcus versicolor TaxID=501482 RepID=UPI0031DA9B4E
MNETPTDGANAIESAFLSDRHHPAYGSRSSPSPTDPGPGFLSHAHGYEGTRHEFERGMQALGFDVIHPQQADVQRVIDSTGVEGRMLYRFVAVDEPRRSGKSEATYGLAIGRCLERRGYRVALTFATTGTKAAQRFKSDIFGRLERWAERTGTTLRTIKSNGLEGIHFEDTDSRIMILPPKGDAFRSEAFDLALVDEAGEASADGTAMLLQAIIPTMDTRPTAQLVVAGTPATFRDGQLLWDVQRKARDGKRRYGAVFYGVPVDLTLEDVETWEQVAPLLQAYHPGVACGLTDLEIMEEAYEAMGPARFMREYLGQFGLDATSSGIINPAKWEACEAPAGTPLPTPPEHHAVAFAVSHDQAFSCMAAAWRGDDGRAIVGLLAYDPGQAWLPERVNGYADKHPRVPIGHDSKGTVQTEVEKVAQARKRTVLHPQSWMNVQTAAALLVREVHRGMLVHFGQAALTDAALVASRRGDQSAFAFGRPTPEAQIVAVEAASMALRLYDATPKAARRFSVVLD